MCVYPLHQESEPLGGPVEAKSHPVMCPLEDVRFYGVDNTCTYGMAVERKATKLVILKKQSDDVTRPWNRKECISHTFGQGVNVVC